MSQDSRQVQSSAAEKKPGQLVEFACGSLSAACSTVFTNPLDVLKTRFQLQGELRMRGAYTRTYRNVLHATYTIARHDGLLALQRGLVPHLVYQMVINGSRLGTYQICVNRGWTKDALGNNSFMRTVFWGAACGAMSGWLSCPFYMIKTRIQAQAKADIAVGHQHSHNGMIDACRSVLRDTGLRGMWRGWDAMVLRVCFSSAAQLSTFSALRQYLERERVVPSGLPVVLLAATGSGAITALVQTPFDVVATRLMNQPNHVVLDDRGVRHFRPATYKNAVDCFVKIFKAEGLHGLFKGLPPVFYRLAPHTVLNLTIWDQLRTIYFTKIRVNSQYSKTG